MSGYMVGTLVAVIISASIGLRVIRKIGILDKPGKDVPQRDPVPSIQGLVLMLTFFLVGGLMMPHSFSVSGSNPYLGLMLGGLLVGGVSLIDEMGRLVHKKFRVGSMVRLFTHIVAATLALFVSGVGITQFQMGGGEIMYFHPLVSWVLTVAWFILFVNAINWFDGIYGLASGISSVGFLTIYLLIGMVVFPHYTEMTPEISTLLATVQDHSWLLFSLAFVALLIERKPFGLLRDVGTMFLGFALAYMGLLGGTKIGMLIVVLSLPLFDAIWVIIDRYFRRKKHPMKGDYSHLHYRLLALGRNRNEIRVFILGWSLFLMILMLLLGADRGGKIIIFLLMAALYFGLHYYLYWVKGLPGEYMSSSKKDN